MIARRMTELAGRLTLLAAVVLVVLLPLTVHAAPQNERRIALVIGISAYQNAPHLPNPVNDARAIGDSLRRLKFEVTELYDPDFRALSSGIRSFGILAANADVAVVYYAGHGMQVNRVSWLIPTDAELKRERDLFYEAMPLERLLDEVSQARHIGIVLLDSCRNNPFIEHILRSMTTAGRAVATTPGLARVDKVPRNTMVVMAAKAGQVAQDGQEHSPFAAALLAHFQIPGLELSLFFRGVRDTVLKATSNLQEPYVFSSLGAEPFYFYPRAPNRPPVIGSLTPLEVTEVAGPTSLGLPEPSDPDQDPLSIRIIGLPRFGEVRVEGRTVTLNAVFSAERLKTAVYKPDGKSIGGAGTLDLLIEDRRGGSVTASLPIMVRSSHHLPVLAGPKQVEIAQQVLSIPAPVSPDGDPLTVTITALPRGSVRNGTVIVRPGNHVTPQELSRLTFWPETGVLGPVGSLRYTVDNGHGSVVEGVLDIDVGPASGSSNQGPEAALWVTVRSSSDPAEFDAFLRLLPNSRYAEEAKRRRAALVEANGADIAARAKLQKAVPVPPPAVPPASEPPAAPGQIKTAANVPPVAAPSAASRGQGRDAALFQDCPACPRMVRIPKGSFMMGLGGHEPESLPVHRVEVRAFAIGQAPVTVGEWKACMAAGACKFLPRMRIAEDRTPVHNVSWDDVGQYTAWLSSIAGHPYRLPGEAEWEYAARAGTTTRYWWGESVGMHLANCQDCGGAQDAYAPLPVDALPPNPYGLYDMLGGVAQWMADCWFPNYRGAPADAMPRAAKDCEKRVLRGGSFRSPHDEITVTYRFEYDAAVRYLVNGFHVARELDQASAE